MTLTDIFNSIKKTASEISDTVATNVPVYTSKLVSTVSDVEKCIRQSETFNYINKEPTNITEVSVSKACIYVISSAYPYIMIGVTDNQKDIELVKYFVEDCSIRFFETDNSEELMNSINEQLFECRIGDSNKYLSNIFEVCEVISNFDN
jgi:hypothetical protein